VSYTTRPQRPGEQDGIDYHFVTRTVFDSKIAQGAFAEWAEVHGNRYGTAIETLERFRSEGRDILLDIDCQGARQLKKSYRQGVFIFVLPPSLTELQRRLNGRNTDSPEVIARRIANARDEIREAVWYDYLVINDDFSQAFSELKSIVLAEGCRTSRQQAIISRILESE
jgi:guanylate kinase